MKSGTRKKNIRMITVWMDEGDVSSVDQAAVLADLDRSKFIRKAIREKMARFPITPKEVA